MGNHRLAGSGLTARGLTASGLTASGLTASGLTALGGAALGVAALGVAALGVAALGVAASGHARPPRTRGVVDIGGQDARPDATPPSSIGQGVRFGTMTSSAGLSIADRIALSDLVHRYAAYTDARRFDDLAELFTATAQLTLPTPPEHLDPVVRHDGRAGVRAAMESLNATIRTQHGIVGELYASTSADGIATGSLTGVAHHWIDNNGQLIDVVWYLRYADEYHRTDAGWRIARRALSVDATETRPVRHVRPR